MTTETIEERRVTQREPGRDFYDWLRIAVPAILTFALGVFCGVVTAIIFVVD